MIERIDLGQRNLVDIHSFVYLLSLTAVLTTLLWRRLARHAVYWLFSFWAVVYILLKLLVFNQRAFWGGVYTYLTLTELGFLLLLVYLAYRVALDLREFREAARYIALADAGRRLLNVADAAPEIRREMTRSRHFHRSLSVVVVRPAPQDVAAAAPRLVAEIQQATAEFCTAARLAGLIGDQTRVVDTVMADGENGRFILLCPEIDARGVHMLTERIQQALSDQVGVQATFGVASFPNEAVTFEALLAAAGDKLLQQTDQPAQPMIHKLNFSEEAELLT
ncbi:MAG: hypothetical protein KC425_03680 [Anaerolineales bacterium]|nr:hypothetical protein [Anaerolineales bacterium]